MTTPKKKHLIELMIEAGVKWPDGAEYAAQDKKDNRVHFYKDGKPLLCGGWLEWVEDYECTFIGDRYGVLLPSLCRNWHQTIVTREQYAEAVAAAESWNAWSGGRNPVDYHCDVEVKLRSGSVLSGIAGEFGWLHDDDGGDILYYRLIDKKEHVDKSNQVRESEGIPQSQQAPQYCASVMRQMPDNTIEQLTADYHAKAAEADRMQAVADEALKAADDALIALEKAGELIGLVISIDTKPKRVEQPAQPEITDWRDLRAGDVIECIEPWGGSIQSVDTGIITKIHGEMFLSDFEKQRGYAYKLEHLCVKFRFIRRP